MRDVAEPSGSPYRLCDRDVAAQEISRNLARVLRGRAKARPTSYKKNRTLRPMRSVRRARDRGFMGAGGSWVRCRGFGGSEVRRFCAANLPNPNLRTPEPPEPPNRTPRTHEPPNPRTLEPSRRGTARS